MAVPKKRTSKQRRNTRRAHDAVTPPTLIDCKRCHDVHRQHRVCPTCGTYAGREILEVVDPAEAVGGPLAP